MKCLQFICVTIEKALLYLEKIWNVHCLSKSHYKIKNMTITKYTASNINNKKNHMYEI